MRKVLSFALLSLCLLGTGCSMQGIVEKDTAHKVTEVDFFNKKVECNTLRASVETRISTQTSWAHVQFLEMCYSKKYNSCVIEYVTTVKNGTLQEMNDATVTYFEDALTGRTLHSLNKDQKTKSVDAYSQAAKDVDCVK